MNDDIVLYVLDDDVPESSTFLNVKGDTINLTWDHDRPIAVYMRRRSSLDLVGPPPSMPRDIDTRFQQIREALPSHELVTSEARTMLFSIQRELARKTQVLQKIARREGDPQQLALGELDPK